MLGWAWWLVVYEGCKKKGVLENCRIPNLGSEVEGAREHLEDATEEKTNFNHELLMMADMTTGYFRGKVQAGDKETCITDLAGSTSDPPSSPLLEFHGDSLICWLSGISRSLLGNSYIQDKTNFY